VTVLAAVAVVGAGSLLFRLGPLLGAERLPDGLSRAAGWAGLAVLAAITVRTVVNHRDAEVPAAPVLAAAAVTAGLYLAVRGRPLLISMTVGAASYLALSGALHAVTYVFG
jgi:branched-subunit amino acid transport protein